MISETRALLIQHLIDGWQFDEVPVFHDNQPDEAPPTDAAWCRFSVRFGGSSNWSGSSQNGTMIQQGRVWLQIFTPQKTRTTQADIIADHFAALFRNKRINGTIVFSTQEVSSSPDPDWMMTVVNVPFTSFEPN